MGASVRPQPPRKMSRLEELAGVTPETPQAKPPKFTVEGTFDDVTGDSATMPDRPLSALERLAAGLPPEQPNVSKAESSLFGAAGGAMYGFDDHLAAAAAAAAEGLTGGNVGETYRASLKDIKAKDAAAKAAHPGITLGSEFAGGLLGPSMGASTAKTLLGGIKAGAKVGAVGGGIGGAGNSEAETLGEFAGDVGTGAAVGTVVGGAASPLIRGAGAVGRGLLDLSGLRPSGAPIFKPPTPTRAGHLTARTGAVGDVAKVGGSKSPFLDINDEIAELEAQIAATGNPRAQAALTQELEGLYRTAEIAELTEQIAATTNPKARALLQAELSGLQRKSGNRSGAVDLSGVLFGAEKGVRSTISSVEQRAADDILAKLNQGDQSLDGIRAMLASRGAGKPENIMDVAGQPMRKLGRAARTASPKAASQIDEAMESRAIGAEERIIDDLLQTTSQGTRTNRFTDFDELVETTKRNAKPLYDEAYKATVNGPLLKEAVKLPQFREAYNAGLRLAGIERRALPSLEEATEKGFPVEAVDYMKRGLDAIIEAGSESGKSMSRTEARALRNRLAEVLKEVDSEAPAYGKARKQFAGDKELEEVPKLAEQHTTRHPDLTQKMLDDMSEAARAKYRQHAFEALAAKIEGTQPGHDISRKIASTTLDKRRLRMLFPDEESFTRFQDLIAREAQMNASRNFLRGNSQTADKLTELADLAGVSVEGMLSGNPTGFLRGLAAKAATSGMAERKAEALAPRLTSTDFPTLLKELAEAETRRAGRAGRQAATAGAASRTAGSRSGERER